MFRPRVMPCLLLKGKGLVKTIQFKDPKYLGDPINAVRIFNEKETDELIFLDITATQENRTIHIDIVHQIGDECYMPFAVGGGIKSIDSIREILSVGAEKVILNSYAIENPDFLTNAAEKFGTQSIVVSIDVRHKLFGKNEVYINGGKKGTHLDPVSVAVKMEEKGAGEILINSINRDGTGQGYDLDLIKTISNSVKIPVIACGGAGKLEHFREAIDIGNASAIAAGSLFVFHGPRKAVLINYPTRSELYNLFRS
jgi:cyclase